VSLRIVVPEEVALTLAEDGLLDAHLDDDPGALAAAIERLISVYLLRERQ
jgi:flagellar basal body rod protein FlgF